MNIAMIISELKRTVIEMISTTSKIKREKLYAQMTLRHMKAVVLIRPNRSSARVKNINLCVSRIIQREFELS